MSRLLDALARLPAGPSDLTPDQTSWLRRELAAAGLAPQKTSTDAQTWHLSLEGYYDEQASARITLPTEGCGSALINRGWHHVDASIEQVAEQATPITKNITNGGRNIAQALLARLPSKAKEAA